eukprot:c24434_g1_i1 orf=571-3564(+)
MDDFEKAIIISFDQSGGVDAQLRAQAMAFCQGAKQSPTILQVCLDKFRSTQFAEVQFWCLQTLEELVKVRYRLLDVQEKSFLQSTLLGMLCSYGLDEDANQADLRALSHPVFVKNKLAQIIVILICIDYPSGWPSVFLDLLGFLAKGPGVVDMFCRVMNTLDEEVISLDYARTQEEVVVATRIKDAMRQQCVTQIVGSCYNLVLAYKGVRPQLAGMVLDMLSRCVDWIDINLVANDTFIPTFFDFILSTQERIEVRGAAADCLLAIVLKKMDVSLKLNLLRQLQIGRICGSFIEKQDSDMMLKLSNLFTGFATEVLCCHKKLSGSQVNDQVTASIEELLDAVLPSVFYFLQYDEEDISSTTFQFFTNYITAMKTIKSSQQKQNSHLTQMLDAIYDKMRYDPADKDSLDVPDKAGKEEEERMCDYRKDLLGLFRSIHRIAPSVSKNFVKATLARVFGNPDVPFEDAEASIMLLYVLGEGLSEEFFKSGGDVVEMVGMLFSGQISCHSHRLVALLYLESVTRYGRFVQHHPEYIPVVLGIFLDKRGIHHPNPDVSGRASYLFMRFVKMLRLQLLPYVEIVLQSLQDILTGFTTTKAFLKKSQSMNFEDGSHAFEAIGLLLGMEELSEDKQTKFLSALLVPLCTQVDSLLSNRPLEEDPAVPSATVVALQQVIVAMNSLSKGFGEQLATCTRPTIGMLFKQALDVLLRVLQVFPKNKTLRGKVISFLHRMIETLGSAMFPYLPTAFQQLLVESEPREMLEFLVLINQLMSTFKSGIKDLIQELFPFILGQIFAILPKETYPDGPESHTEEMQDLQELERVYFTFLQGITSNELSSIMLSFKNSHLLNDIIQSTLVASCQHKDVLVRKVCVQIFSRLIKDWCGTRVEEEKVPGFRGFVVKTFAAKCCVYSVLESSFNLRDANTFNLFGEIVAAQKVIYEHCGNEFLIHQATQVMPAVHCPPNMAEQYCFHIQRSDVKDLKSFYKSLVEKLKPHQNGSMVPR